MLRPKQFISLCQGGRSLLVGALQNKSVDGFSSAYFEDDTGNSITDFNISNKDPAQKSSILPSIPAKQNVFRKGLEDSTGSIISLGADPINPQPTSLCFKDTAVSNNLLEGSTQAQDTTKNAQAHIVSDVGASFIDNFVWAGVATIDFLSGLVDYQNNNVLFMVNPDRTNSSNRAPRGTLKSASIFSRSHKTSSTEREDVHELNALDRNTGSALNQRRASERYDGGPSYSKSTKGATYIVNPRLKAPTNSQKHCQESIVSNPVRNVNAGGHISRAHVQEKSAGSKPISRKFASSTTGNNPRGFWTDGYDMGNSETIGSGLNKGDAGNNQIHAGATQRASRPLCGGSIEQVANILRQMNWGPATEMALANNLNLKLDVYQVNQILKLQKNPGLALNFFYWTKRQTGFKHDGHSYTTMIGILGCARQFGAVKKLLVEMRKDGCEPNVVTYNRLIHCYGRANYIRDAVNIFFEMQEAGCKPDRVTYCTLIDIHAKAGFLDVAIDMYDNMQKNGLLPDTFTYGVIINCLGKAGDLSSAYKIFREMIDHGCIPNLVTYNIIIDLHAKARKYSTALNLYRDMQNAGFYPDKVTYSIVMEVLGHCGQIEEAEAVFSEMQQGDWIPDEPVYGLLVDMWGKAGNVHKASEWYSKMLNSGIRPNVPTCNSLLSAFLRVRMFSDAHRVLQTMLQLNLYPSLQTYTLLLSCYTESQCQQDRNLYSSLMASTRHPAHSFLLALPAAEPGGQNVRDHAASFFDMMHSEDRESKRGLVDAVINFLHKSDLKEEAGFVWEVALQKNLYPYAVTQKAPMYWLINLHVMSTGTALIALSRTLAWFREHLLISGLGPDRIDIITGWGRRSRVMGSSLVKQSIEHLLHLFESPFQVEDGNSGCLVGSGNPLTVWLHQPYVERMHLL